MPRQISRRLKLTQGGVVAINARQTHSVEKFDFFAVLGTQNLQMIRRLAREDRRITLESFGVSEEPVHRKS